MNQFGFVKKVKPWKKTIRYPVYCRSYGDRERAVATFQAISPNIRREIALTDYSQAERVCPQNMAIGRLMREAIKAFS